MPEPSTEILQELLNRLAYLKDATSEDELGYYLHGVERITVPAHTLLYTQGTRVDRIYLLLSGRVEEVRTRPAQGADAGAAGAAGAGADVQEHLLREAAPGTLLGLYDLVYRKPHSSLARAAAPCELMRMEAAQVNRLLYRYPELRSSMLPAARIERLRTMPLLATADAVAISYLADAAEARTYNAGDTIYQAGDAGARIFLLDEGQVRLDDQGGNTVWLGNGGDFGYNGHLIATAGPLDQSMDHNATAVSSVRVLALPRRTLVAATGIRPELEGPRLRALRTQTLDQIGVFGAWPLEDRTRLLGFMSHYFIPGSHLMTQQGEVADSLWVLLPGGRAVVHALRPTGEALPEMRLEGPGYFNEAALRAQTLASGTLEAEPNSHWLRLHWQDFRIFLEQAGRQELAAQLRINRQALPPPEDPARGRYKWLEQNERVLLEVRRHWIVALAKIAPAILLSLLFGWLAVAMFDFAYFRIWLTLLAALLALTTLGAWLWGVVDYANDFLIVTNLRVVRQEKVVLFKESRQIAPLEKIQEVSFKQDAWGSWFHFADLEVQTPGPAGNIRFDRVANFEFVSQQIRQERDVRRRHYEATGKKIIYSVLEDRFGGALMLPSRVWVRSAAAVSPAAPAALHWMARLTNAGSRLNPLHARRAAAPPAQEPARGPRADRYVWHKHWIILLRVIVGPLLLLAAASVLALFFFAQYQGGFQGGLVGITIFAALCALVWLWWNVENWSNDVYILEKDQLIDIERLPLGLKNEQRTAALSQIVDIQMRVPSPLHYLLNYGNVLVQTAAQDGTFTFLNVPDPAAVVETIRRRVDQSRQADEQRAARQRAQEFPDWLEVYSRLDPNREETGSGE